MQGGGVALIVPIPVAVVVLPVAAVMWLYQRMKDRERGARNAQLKRENQYRDQSGPGRQDW